MTLAHLSSPFSLSRLVVCSFVFPLVIGALVTGATLPNKCTVTLPPGASNHGDPDLLCVPTKWTDIIVFFLGNYIAHAATIVSMPGASFLDTVILAVRALFIPVSGVNRGLDGLFSLAKFAPTDLQAAARAGALCKVIHVDENENTSARALRRPKISLLQPWMSGNIYGRVKLPPGYGLSVLPRNAQFADDEKDSITMTLCSDYSAVRVLVSIGQLLFASSTLYRSRGDEVNRYGFAAFGLTVTQYALMSLLNLLGNLMCPQYPTLYLVESKAMLDARAVPGTVFEGMVGRLIEDDELQRSQQRSRRRNKTFFQLNREGLLRLPFALVPTAISLTIIGSLSHFRYGSSTYAQRVWLMTWLAVGSWIGAAAGDFRKENDITRAHDLSSMIQRLCFDAMGATPAIGGFVVVGKMLQDYGVCTRIS